MVNWDQNLRKQQYNGLAALSVQGPLMQTAWMRAALARGNNPLICGACHVGGRAGSNSKRSAGAGKWMSRSAGTSIGSTPPFHFFTLKDLLLYINLYIQTAFTLGNNKRSFYSTNRFLHIGLGEGSTEANVQWNDSGSLFQAALTITHTVCCTEW